MSVELLTCSCGKTISLDAKEECQRIGLDPCCWHCLSDYLYLENLCQGVDSLLAIKRSVRMEIV